MIYWTREIVGWALIGLGLIVFGVTYFGLLAQGRIFHAIPLTFIGFVIFRGGIHLVKVAVAARLCRELAEQPKPKPVRSDNPRKALPRQRTVPPPLPGRSTDSVIRR